LDFHKFEILTASGVLSASSRKIYSQCLCGGDYGGGSVIIACLLSNRKSS